MILSGWKEIAGYLRCGVRTAQRWEKDGLPVHRPIAAKRSVVIARCEELDRWVRRDEFSKPSYPRLIASIANAQRLQDEALARLTELQARVTGLQAQVADLHARRSRNLIVPRRPLAAVDEVAGSLTAMQRTAL